MRPLPVLVAAFVIVAAAPAVADTASVNMIDHAYVPARAIVLKGDTVGWRNGSLINNHTVTGNGFDSGPISPAGGFFHPFTESGLYPYLCTIHPFMAGEVDVYGALLNEVGPAVARGAAATLTGRAAPGVDAIDIQEDTGGGFHTVATAKPASGAFRATVHPPANASYRAVAGPDSSPPIQVEVSDRSEVSVKASRRHLKVHVDPLDPCARVSLQFKLRERFGWWTVARARLNERSRVRFHIRPRKPLWARAVLTQSDGWTILAASAAIRVRPRRAR